MTFPQDRAVSIPAGFPDEEAGLQTFSDMPCRASELLREHILEHGGQAPFKTNV